MSCSLALPLRVVARWQPDLPMAGGRVFRVRDMMIDRVAPLPGVRPLILIGPSAVIDGGRRWWRGLTVGRWSWPRLVPVIAEIGLPVPVFGFSQRQRAMVVGAAGWAMTVNASSPRLVRMWVACRTIRRAWDRQARFAS